MYVLLHLPFSLWSNTRYVDQAAVGNNAGTSWSNAYQSLNDALTAAHANTSIDTILIAQGTYTPSTSPGIPNTMKHFTFFIKRHNLKILGGYPSGGGTRDPNQYPTLLSGKLNATDTVNHVMVILGTSSQNLNQSLQLNGLTICHSAAIKSVDSLEIGSIKIPPQMGGGIYTRFAAPILNNLLFEYNNASREGGGLYTLNNSDTLIVDNCIFRYNNAQYSGGGYTKSSWSTATIKQSQFLNNSSVFGGGLMIGTQTTTVTNCIFKYNTSTGGGGLCFATGGNLALDSLLFEENTGTNGGAVYLEPASSFITANRLWIYNNFASVAGGGIYLVSGINAKCEINNVIISGNQASHSGGGLWSRTSNLILNKATISNNESANGGGCYFFQSTYDDTLYTIKNSLITGNTATANGGAIHINGNANKKYVFHNVTIAGNNAANGSGALYNNATPNVHIYNSIIWNNNGSIVDAIATQKTNVHNAIIQGAWAGTNNFDQDPLFTNSPAYTNAPFATGDYTLQNCSPAVNMGDNNVLKTYDTVDFYNNKRVYGRAVDAGAYEMQQDHTSRITVAKATANDINLLPMCEELGFTYYAIPNNPDSVAFAIRWGTQNQTAKAAATISLNALATPTIVTNNLDSALIAMPRYWNVNLHGASLTEPVALKFFYTAQDTIDLYNALAALNMPPLDNIKWIKTTGNAYTPAAISLQQINNGNYVALTPQYDTINNVYSVTFENLNSFSGGTAVISNFESTPLSADLFSLKAQPGAMHSVAVSWSISNEHDYVQLYLEHSQDAQGWQDLTQLSIDDKTQNKFIDHHPFNGKNYYRLRGITIEQQLQYSNIQMVDLPATADGFTLSPNPSYGKTSLYLNQNKVLPTIVKIYNSVGQLWSVHSIQDKLELDTQDWPKGLYIIHCSDKGNTKVQKLIVE